MCGIAGFWRAGLDPEMGVQVVLAMLGRISHRGPDEYGYYVAPDAALAVARLAVRDRVGGRQPFADETRRHWLAFNGELYNDRELRRELRALGRVLRTRSDTEVVLAAWLEWKAEALARFEGGFALAVYDRTEGRLILARDPWGKRPLFYVAMGDGVVFASEMKAFLAFPDIEFRWDAGQLSSLFTIWTPLPDATPFTGVLQVPPGGCCRSVPRVSTAASQ